MKKLLILALALGSMTTFASGLSEVETYTLEHGKQYQVNLVDDDSGQPKKVILKVPSSSKPVCQNIDDHRINNTLYIGGVKMMVDRAHKLNMVISSLRSVGACR